MEIPLEVRKELGFYKEMLGEIIEES